MRSSPILCLGIVAYYLAIPIANAQEDRAVMVAQGWKAFNSKKYDEATEIAQACVDQFGRQAARDQQRIDSSKVRPLPPGRADPKSADAQVTFSNGVLNDASACMFILANSQERMGRCTDAKGTYKALSQLTYARIWDPQGWFWAPSESAMDAAHRLEKKC